MESLIPEQSKILNVLKTNITGLTVGEISKHIDLNRNSVAKYLDVLLISGNVEMRQIGPAKLFFPSKRVPTSKLLDYSSNEVLVLDNSLHVIQANKTMISDLRTTKKEILGKSIFELKLNANDNESFIIGLKNNKQSEIIGEYEFKRRDRRYYYKYKILKSCYDDGGCGKVVVFEDITSQKEYEKKLRFNLDFEDLISQIAIDFIYLRKEDIEELICKSIRKIGKMAKVDNCFIYLFDKQEVNATRIYKWNIEKEFESIKTPMVIDFSIFEKWQDNLKKFEPVICHKSRLPKEAVVEKEFMEKINMSSFVLSPLMYKGDLVGFFGLGNVKEDRYWKNSISLLNTTGRIFTEVFRKSGVLEKYNQ